MNQKSPAMIVSGVPYEVTDVEGQVPTDLADFGGPVTMTTHGPTGDHEVVGAGELEHHGVVRVHEKDHEGSGKDVRVWTVSPHPDPDHDGFVAAG